jgi:hypothetical protein
MANSQFASALVGLLADRPAAGVSKRLFFATDQGPAGTMYEDDGSTWTAIGGFAQSLTPTAVKTAAYTAAPGDLVPVDTTAGAVTITLPTAPADRTRIAIKMVAQGGTNAVTVAAGGADVFNKTGGGTTLTLSLLLQAVNLQYRASGAIWYVVSDDLALAQLDARYAGFDTTAPSSSAEGDVAATGNASAAARRDHVHGRESFATPAIALSNAAAAGAATTPIRSDATIAAFDATAPTASLPGDAAAVGTAAVASRRDHVHSREPKTQVFTANGSFTVPSNASLIEVYCVGGGGGGGGGGSASNNLGTLQSGGSGGGAGGEVHGFFTVAGGTVLTVTVGASAAGGNGGAGGGAGGNAGAAGTQGNNSSVTGTGVSILGRGGGNGVGSSANSTSNATGGGPGNSSVSTIEGAGGNSGAVSRNAKGLAGSGGGGGGAATATNGGGGGGGGQNTGSTAAAGTSGGSGTSAGANGADGVVPGSGGGGGGGGAGTAVAGAGGNGGAGAAGLVVIRVVG